MQVGHKMGQDGARWTPNGARQAQVSHKMGHEEGKMGTQRGQEGEREAQVGPKSSQKKGDQNKVEFFANFRVCFGCLFQLPAVFCGLLVRIFIWILLEPFWGQPGRQK